MTSAGPAHVDHRLLEYGSAGAFVDGVLPFLSEGMKLGEPSLVVVSARHLAILRDLLGPDAADWVRFADSDAWGSGNVPTRVLSFEWTIRKLLATAVRCRFVGEFTWPGATQRREWCRHEAAANLLHISAQVSMLCTIDTRGSSAEFLEDLRRTHPIIAPARPNPDFVDPWTYLTQWEADSHRSAPPHAETSTVVDELDLHPMRERLAAEARTAGLGDYQIQCLALAATEIVTNVLHHAGTIATIKTWTEEFRFCCEIADKGPGLADPLAAYQPPAPASGRCGLWLARTFSDELRVTSSDAGTAARISYSRS